MLMKQLARSFFSNAAILRTAQGLTMVLVIWYFMADHSGPFHFSGLLLNQHGDDAVKDATVTYEYKLVDNQTVESKSVKVPSGFFYIGVSDTEIIYVKITGIWIGAMGSKRARNILPTMSTSQKTSLLFEPGSFFHRDKRHWNSRKTYIFQEGKPVRAELPKAFEE